MVVLGVATGLDATLLLAGFVGGLWAQTYVPTAPYLQRLLMTVLASLIASYLSAAGAGVILAVLTTWSPAIGGAIPVKTLEVPGAVIVGLLCHRYIGPLLMKLASRKMEDAPK